MTGPAVGLLRPTRSGHAPALAVKIRPARQRDLNALVQALGQREFFADRLARQQLHRGVLFTAWAGREPIGDVYLWLDPADEPDIRAQLPGVPLLTHLEVRPECRDAGVGSNLIRAVEDYLLMRGFDRVALAVELDNKAAARLYQRLGFRDWGHPDVDCFHDERQPDGTLLRCSETCHVLVKALDRAS